MGSPFKMKPGKGGSAKHTGRGMTERGLISGGPKSHGKPHYDTTEAGRPTVYGATEAIPASIKQRVGSTSSGDDVSSGKSFTKDPKSGESWSTQYHNKLYSNENSTVGEFKRRTALQNKNDASQMSKSMQQGYKPQNRSGYQNTEISSSASTMDPRSGKSLLDSGAFGTPSQVANYGFGDAPGVRATKAASFNPDGKKALRDSKIVENNIAKAAVSYKTGEKAITLGSNEIVKSKGPDINSQLLGGFKVGDGPKPPQPKKPSNIHIVSRSKAGKVIGDIFGKRKNRSGKTIVRSSGGRATI